MFAQRLNELHSALSSTYCTCKNEKLDINIALKHFHELLSSCSINGRKIYVIGNGGSSSIASHFVTDLVKALQIAAICFSDASLITCLSNDLGYEHVYATPLKLLINENDTLVAISSSGQSPNILKAVKIAKEKNASVITLSGFLEDNPLRESGDLNFYIERSDYGIVEIAHSFLLHTLVDLWKSMNSQKTKLLINQILSHAK